MALGISEGFALVDWDTARRCRWLSSVERAKVERGGVQAQLEAVQKRLAPAFLSFEKARFRVQMRIYHGWHRGLEPTADYRDLSGLRPRRNTIDQVLFAPPILGDELACRGRYGKLRDTVRRREESSILEQKMVDTAIAADLLFLARSKLAGPRAWFVVLSELQRSPELTPSCSSELTPRDRSAGRHPPRATGIPPSPPPARSGAPFAPSKLGPAGTRSLPCLRLRGLGRRPARGACSPVA